MIGTLFLHFLLARTSIAAIARDMNAARRGMGVLFWVETGVDNMVGVATGVSPPVTMAGDDVDVGLSAPPEGKTRLMEMLSI